MKVSLIVPTKHRLGLIPAALEIMRMNMRPQDECIVQDGGMDAHVGTLVDRHGFTLVSQPNTSGANGTNIAIQHATGDYVRTCADDDVYFSEASFKASEILERQPEIDMLILGGVRLRSGADGTMHVQTICLPRGIDYGSDVTNVSTYGCNAVAAFFKRSMLDAMSGFDEASMFTDVDFTMRAITEGYNVKVVRLFGWYHMIWPHSVVKLNTPETKKAENIRLRAKYGISEDYPRALIDMNPVWDGEFA